MSCTYSSRAFQGSLNRAAPSRSKIGARLSRSQSRAFRRGSRHCWFQPRPSARVASAVPEPPVDAVGTAPRGSFDNFDLHGRRVQLQVLAVDGQADILARLDEVEGGGQRHVPAVVMVAVRLAVGGDVDEPGLGVIVGEAAQEPLREVLAPRQQAVECHVAGQLAVIKEKRNRSARGQTADVGRRRYRSSPMRHPASRHRGGGCALPGEARGS